MKNIRLGDLLIELGYITPDQLTAALAYQKEHRDLRVGQACRAGLCQRAPGAGGPCQAFADSAYRH